MNHLTLSRALLATDNNALLQRRRQTRVQSLALALFARMRAFASGAFAAVSLLERMSVHGTLRENVTLRTTAKKLT